MINKDFINFLFKEIFNNISKYYSININRFTRKANFSHFSTKKLGNFFPLTSLLITFWQSKKGNYMIECFLGTFVRIPEYPDGNSEGIPRYLHHWKAKRIICAPQYKNREFYLVHLFSEIPLP